MSEKRFKLWQTFDKNGHTDKWGVIDTDADDIDYEEYVYDEDEVVELLNTLHENNRQLNEEIIQAINQGYCADFLHKPERCSLIPCRREENE